MFKRNGIFSGIAGAMLACSMLFSGSALALLDFQVDPSGLGSGESIFTADQLNGNYTETLSLDGAGGFEASGVFNINSFINDGNPVTQTGLLNDYGLYALFQFSGTVAPSGTDVIFTATSGSVEVWGDLYGSQTTFTLDKTGTWGDAFPAVANAADDIKLATASNLTFGDGTFDTNGPSNGDFEIIFNDFTLTNPEGTSVFISPDPFYLILDVNGNFQAFDFTGGAQNIEISSSSANAFFSTVPEPGALALFSIGLLGLGFIGRRRTPG